MGQIMNSDNIQTTDFSYPRLFFSNESEYVTCVIEVL